MLDIIQELLNNPTFKRQVKYSTKLFHANEKILEQGKPREYVYLIKKGKVRISISSQEIKEQFLHPGIIELGPDSTFGEFGLFDNQPLASADVTAITDCELIVIDIITFRDYLDKNPDIGYKISLKILSSLINRIHHYDKTILTLYGWGMKAHKLDKY